MFDPTKLNIDLDNIDNKSETKDRLEKNKINEKIIYNIEEKIDSQIIEPQNTNKKDITKETSNKTNIEQIGKTDNTLEDILGDMISIEKGNFSEYGDMKDAPDLKETLAINNNLSKDILFDVNIESLQSIVNILISNKYTFALIEPQGSNIKITFKKDKVDKESRYIKYPTYTKILLKAKSITKLDIEGTEDEQQGQGKIIINTKAYKIFTKTIPSGYGEKLYLKVEESKVQISKKIKKKTSMMQVFGFLGAMAFVALIIGGGFLTFIVLNAKNPSDVVFFSNLGINLNDINTFVSKTVTIIFSLLIFIESIFLLVYLFKFILTKKSYKKKKIYYGIVAALTLIVTFISGSIWMIIHKKISELPNWDELSRGSVVIFDNGKLKSKKFNINSSIINNTESLIGPLSIKYDLSNYKKKKESKGFSIKKYKWTIGGKEIEKIEPILIYNFLEKGIYDISLETEEVDASGKMIFNKINDLKPVNITYIVDIKQTTLNNGGKIVEFDASSLTELGNIEWYYGENLKEMWKGKKFQLPPIFNETLIGMAINNTSKKTTKLDKIFIINGGNKNSIRGKIVAKQMIINDLEYELKVKNPRNDIGDGFINEFKWIIGDQEIVNKGDISNPEKSSKIIYIFKKYGKHNISVTMTDSSGKVKILNFSIDIPKKLRLKQGLKIINEGEELTNVRYNPKNKEYFIDGLLVPTILTLDARRIKADNNLYTLEKVTWDVNSNGNIDGKGKEFKYPIDIEGNHHLTVNYTFANKIIKDDKIRFKENLYIEGLKKEALLYLKIEKDSNYAPILIRFDASKSQVKNQNIVKFLWDYGDGTPIEERGSINPGHRYNESGDYTIRLTVITEEGNKYFIEKKLILTTTPQVVKIKSSIKKALLGQGIEFSSEESEGQIESYFWDFGDNKTSFEANPSHIYKRKGKYKVKLKVDFSNNNQLNDEIEIQIY